MSSRRTRFCVGYVGATCALIVWAMPAPAEPAPDEASPMFRSDAVAAIDLTLPKASEEALEDEPFEYVKGTFSFAYTDGTPGGTQTPVGLPLEVGIRLKGNFVGSFRPLTGKAGFKVKFNEYAKKQRFLGLKKLTLNSMVQDPSMIHETLAYDTFRASGVPSSRTGYAFVRVNGEDFGVYMNIETLDDVGLERWFGDFDDPQHLYEGEYSTDVEPGEEKEFSVDEGDEEDRSDLEALIAAVAGKGAPFSQRVAALAELKEMTRMWAVEKYVGQWDGYAGAGPTLLPFNELPNNYYLFSDAAGKFQMLPWGTDQTWETAYRVPFDGEAGVLFDECLADPACWALYREALVEVGQVAAGLELDQRAEAAAGLLAPWQALEPAREEHDLDEIADKVEETREFIAGRPAELAAWLQANPAPVSTVVPTPTSLSSPPRTQPGTAATLRVKRSKRANPRVLVTYLPVSGPGRVRQIAKIDTDEGRRRACLARSRASSAGTVTLRCQLSDAVLERLRVHGLWLEVSTRFLPESGGIESSVRHIRLARVPAP